MKIGIMTCWQPDDNYGTQMQCFALQHYLRLRGHDAYLIQYLRANDVRHCLTLGKIIKLFNIVKVIRKLHSIFMQKKMRQETFEHNRFSPEFRKRYLNISELYNNYEELKNNPPKADLYIVGSDQVWNNLPVQIGQINSFFLNFGDSKIKRISYAASFGFDKKSMPKKYEKTAVPLLRKFDGISIREQSGLAILNEWGVDKSVMVSDPTLLLDAEHYRNVYNENTFPRQQKKYVLVYNLSAKSAIDFVCIKSWAEKKGLGFVYVPGHGQIDKFEKCYATVPEWLYLIDNAEFVFTNSFHCGIFSSLFHKQFAVFKLDDNYNSTNSRLDTINHLITSCRIASSVNEAFEIVEKTVDWISFEERKEKLVSVGKEFLNKYASDNIS